MLFDERPKDNVKDLYDMETELKSVLSAAKKGSPMVVIVGLRRTGKTSLLLTALNQLPNPCVTVDLRVLAPKPYATKRDLAQELACSFNSLYRQRLNLGKKIFEWLKRVKGVEISSSGISLSWGGKEPVDLAALFDELNAWARTEKNRVMVAFDEAQELRKVAGVDMAKILAHIYDYCRNITIILTGSAIGLLYDFLGRDDPKAALYGRHTVEINLGRLSDEKAGDFLLRGFKQAKLKTNHSIIEQAIRELDGVIGWLTLFGAMCIKKGVSEEAIERTIETGKALAKQEFQNFLKGREVAARRYETIIGQLSRRASTWSEIRRAVEALEGKTINDRNITDLLTTLVKTGFIEKRDGFYILTDHMLGKAFV